MARDIWSSLESELTQSSMCAVYISSLTGEELEEEQAE